MKMKLWEASLQVEVSSLILAMINFFVLLQLMTISSVDGGYFTTLSSHICMWFVAHFGFFSNLESIQDWKTVDFLLDENF